MQEALKNPHYKKIWEKVIMNRHPKAKSLEKALNTEMKYYNCFFAYNDIESYVGEFCKNLMNNINAYNAIAEECAESQSFFERRRFWANFEEKPTILGRAITLEDILAVLPRHSTDHGTNYSGFAIRVCKEVLNIWSDSGIFCFTWQSTKPLHEQTPETWEKIANLID